MPRKFKTPTLLAAEAVSREYQSVARVRARLRRKALANRLASLLRRAPRTIGGPATDLWGALAEIHSWKSPSLEGILRKRGFDYEAAHVKRLLQAFKPPRACVRQRNKPTNARLAQLIAQQLFKDGAGNQASHLCLFSGGRYGRYMGGWLQSAAERVITEVLDKA